MAEQKSNKKYCSLAALRYGQVLYELEIPEEDIEETKAIWESSADLREILEKPVVSGEQKHGIIDRILPEKSRSFLKVLPPPLLAVPAPPERRWDGTHGPAPAQSPSDSPR